MNTAEISRLLANLIKQGTIAESDPAAGRVRVLHGGLTTDWLPYFVPAAGGVSVHRPPSVGENCIVLSPSGEPANGVVLCGMASDQFPQPGNRADETVVKFPDGAVAKYNHAASKLDISGINTANIQPDYRRLPAKHLHRCRYRAGFVSLSGRHGRQQRRHWHHHYRRRL